VDITDLALHNRLSQLGEGGIEAPVEADL
jgi:hypothetical protein